MNSPESFGARPDGEDDCAGAIEKALTAGPVRLTPGVVYRIRRPVTVPSGATLVGDRSARIVGGFRDFPSTVKQGAFGSALLQVRRVEGVRLTGFQIAFENAPDSWMVGVGLAQSKDCVLRDLEIFGFNRGYLIAIDTCMDCRVLACVLRDSRIDSTMNGQLTGVSVDENRVDGASSRGIGVSHNRIARLTVSPAFEKAFGDQTDGVNICGATPDGSGTRAVVTRNVISNVGEGVDTFGKFGLIEGNVFLDCAQVAVKIVHGASGNRVVGNWIDGVGMWGVALGGAALNMSDTDGNVIEDNVITRIGDVPEARTRSPVAFRFVTAPSTRPVTRTIIRNNRVFASPKASFAMQVRDHGVPPSGIVYHSNYYDGSAREGEIDDPRSVDYSPFRPAVTSGQPQSAVSPVSTKAAIALLDFERGIVAAVR